MCYFSGTSPQAWGKVVALDDVDVERRNIPTGVGKSPAAAAAPRAPTGHPHRRGEKPISTSQWTPANGTSPQAWGKDGVHRQVAEVGRNIPTGVGKSPGARRRSPSRTEHPHRRGEKHFTAFSMPPTTGTSPQAWGKGMDSQALHHPRRNIPTGVGKSAISFPAPGWGPEHPHRRGEKMVSSSSRSSDIGTSPQAWGKDGAEVGAGGAGRNIPTGVGKRRAARTRSRRHPEHPHRRGEKPTPRSRKARDDGTSPQAWGKVFKSSVRLGNRRNIPTGVGKRPAVIQRLNHTSEHPHRRGEKRCSSAPKPRRGGTSPQAWGKACAGVAETADYRNIPTGVGKRTHP